MNPDLSNISDYEIQSLMNIDTYSLVEELISRFAQSEAYENITLSQKHLLLGFLHKKTCATL